MAWVPGHDIHQDRGLVAGSGTGHALTKERERQCCVQRCHCLFRGSGMHMA